MLLVILTVRKSLDHFIKKNCKKKKNKKTNEKQLRAEKDIKRKNDKFYAQWKGYDHSFNSWIDKKDSIRFV